MKDRALNSVVDPCVVVVVVDEEPRCCCSSEEERGKGKRPRIISNKERPRLQMSEDMPYPTP